MVDARVITCAPCTGESDALATAYANADLGVARWWCRVLALPIALGRTPRCGSGQYPLPLAGVPNLHRVTPLIYRSAQPTAEGFRNLAEIGRKNRDQSAAHG